MNSRCRTLPTCLNRCLWSCIAIGWTIGSLVGCIEGRSSNHELEHAVPAHWPTSLADAADKIEARINAVEAPTAETAPSRIEIVEILSWVPEVAADCDMREPEWNTVHAACQSANDVMKSPTEPKRATAELRTLCARLRDIHKQLLLTPP